MKDKLKNKININEKTYVNQIHDVLIDKVENFLFNELYIESGERILVAVSGGVDSITMLDILFRISKFHNLEIIPIHFNHKLRGKNSDEDEKFVKNFCISYGLNCIISKGDVKGYAVKKSLSIEQAARILRYNFFERAAHELNCSFVATAHTSDDLTETFFLNLFRGTGLTGLCGIPKRRHLTRKINVIRPILSIKKDELIKYAEKHGLKWREDETNILMNFARNKIRKKLIPFIKAEFESNINEKIVKTAKLLSGAERQISEYVASLVDRITTNKTSEGFSIKLEMFKSLDDFIQGELIEMLVTEKYRQPSLSMVTIDRICGLVDSKIGTIVDINKDLFALRDRNKIIISKRKNSNASKIEVSKEGEFEFNGNKIILKEVKRNEVKLAESGRIEFIDFDLIPPRIFIRSWEKGDNFIPLGMNGKMKISDFLINNKLSLLDKQDIFLLTTGKDIIWVSGLRIDNRFKITKKTKRFLKLELISD
ncbi:MAG: tRNA lysidine(34) synthetase TilS [Bacteroidetes bacterium]|nr:MAG: tRNA lysidine(34) synthetase TilS [Bacteroidota bacterium]